MHLFTQQTSNGPHICLSSASSDAQTPMHLQMLHKKVMHSLPCWCNIDASVSKSVPCRTHAMLQHGTAQGLCSAKAKQMLGRASCSRKAKVMAVTASLSVWRSRKSRDYFLHDFPLLIILAMPDKDKTLKSWIRNSSPSTHQNCYLWGNTLKRQLFVVRTAVRHRESHPIRGAQDGGKESSKKKTEERLGWPPGECWGLQSCPGSPSPRLPPYRSSHHAPAASHGLTRCFCSENPVVLLPPWKTKV